jgi:protein-S-isoprenylcysteine O-methyltransferase Ste14
MKIKALVGSGDRIGRLVLPFLMAGVALNVFFPSFFSVGGPPDILRIISIAVLVPGVVLWLWSVFLILTKVPKGELITYGPYAVVKHPLYTAVALLVLPWLGFLFNTWLGAALGIILYVASRLYAPAEEKKLAQSFGEEWVGYVSAVWLLWL